MSRAAPTPDDVAARRYTLGGPPLCTIGAGIFASSKNLLLVTPLIGLGPLITAAYGGRLRTAMVGAYAIALALAVGAIDGTTTRNEWTRAGIVAVCSLLATWLATLRTLRQSQLENARQGEAEERRLRQSAEAEGRGYRLAGALAGAATPEQVAEAAFETVRSELGASAGVFSTLTSRGTLRPRWSFGFRTGALHRWGEMPVGQHQPVATVIEEMTPLFVESAQAAQDRWPLTAAAMGANDQASLAVLPLVVSNRALGSLAIGWSAPHKFNDEEKNFLSTLAGQTSQAMERARLTLQALDDVQRAVRLQQLSSALAVAVTPVDVARAAINESIAAVGARTGTLRLLDAGGDRLVRLASGGGSGNGNADAIARRGTFEGEALRSRRGVYLEGPDERTARFPDFAAADDLGDGAAVWVPLAGGDDPIGVMAFTFDQPKTFSETERRFLETMAAQCAQSLERARLFERERQARRDAEGARKRLSLLAEITQLVNSSLDPGAVIEALVHLIVGRMADGCAVLVATPEGLERQLIRGDDLFVEGSHQPSSIQTPVPFDGDSPAAVAFRTGQPQLARVTPELLAEANVGLRLSGDIEPNALAVPLSAGGRAIGVMSFIVGPGHRGFGDDELNLALEVASRAGMALDNAQRFQQERGTAEMLQRAVLPDRLVDVPGVVLDAEYRPGLEGTYAGGDWYDAIALDDGRVFFSVGDVMGKGPEAAALMGQVRNALRAYAMVHSDPGAALDAVDHLLGTLGEDRLITTIAGIIDPTTGRTTIANAGHPPPLLVPAGGRVRVVEQGGSLLLATGIAKGRRPSHQFALQPGDALVCYSDGLVERRGETITRGVNRLAQQAAGLGAIGAGAGWASRLADQLSADYETEDDVVVLAVGFTGVGPPADGGLEDPGERWPGRLDLPPEVSSANVCRRWIAEQLAGADENLVTTAALLTSELVTNAVLHAGTDLSVTVHVTGERLRVDVADESPVLPGAKGYGPSAATGRGLTLFGRLASAWGTRPVPGGKVVWFELPVDVPLDLAGEKLLAPADSVPAWPHGATDSVVGDDSELVDVAIRSLPVPAFHRASEEYDALLREFRLMAERDPNDRRQLPARLVDLIDELGRRFAGFAQGADARWRQAVEHAEVTVDLQFRLPAGVGAACQHYGALLDEADGYCRSADLITLPASPESVALRRWFLGEFSRQVAGEPPTPWPLSPWAGGLADHIAAKHS